MNTSRFVLNATLSTALLVLCCGCRNGGSAKHSRHNPTVDDDSRLQVMAIVIRNMGEASGVPFCLLDVTDSEFAWLRREFSLTPPKFGYAQAKGADTKKDHTTLVVAIIGLEVDRATAKGTYVSRNSFSQFRYELLRDGASWKITRAEFVGAS